MTLLTKEGLLEQRAEIILEWTNGRTDSARSLTPDELDIICIQLTERQQKVKNEMDTLRKRVIAVLFEYCKLTNRPQTMDYVKAIACRFKAKKDFNKLSKTELQSCYNTFLSENRSFNYGKRLTGSFHLQAQNYN